MAACLHTDEHLTLVPTFPSDHLRLAADTHQDRSAASLQRGHDCGGLRDRDIKPCTTRYTLHFHINRLFRAGALRGSHRASFLIDFCRPSLLTFAPSSCVRKERAMLCSTCSLCASSRQARKRAGGID